jgi:hypothetical protein
VRGSSGPFAFLDALADAALLGLGALAAKLGHHLLGALGVGPALRPPPRLELAASPQRRPSSRTKIASRSRGLTPQPFLRRTRTHGEWL